jgi:hypothetical protein
MDTPAIPDIQRYYRNHRLLAARLTWLWAFFSENQGTKTHHRAALENFVLQTRLACEQYALLMQSACFESLPDSERRKESAYNAVQILRAVRVSAPHVKIVPLLEVLPETDEAPMTFKLLDGWVVNDHLFERIYSLGGRYLHARNEEFDLAGLQNYLENAINLISQLILVTWRHVTLLDGLAGQVVSQILPDQRHLGFVIEAVGENVPELRAALRGAN